MLNVSGTVAHYTPESLATDQSNAPKSATSTGGAGGNSSGGASSKRKFNADAPIETYPRNWGRRRCAFRMDAKQEQQRQRQGQ